MHTEELERWKHAHTFGQDVRRPGESRSKLVIALTAVTMVVEIGAGVAFGSMALLADGLHMASHAAALSITAVAYVFARRHAADERFSFGAGKVNALAGFTGAILLAVFALMMAWESVARLTAPVAIVFDRAIGVAVLGLLVNGASALLLGHHHGEGEGDEHHHHDHNLRSAYLHVLADALTSLLAILALLAGKHLGLVWMDPVMGVVGALLVAWWSVGLLRRTSAVLLDRQAAGIERSVREAIEGEVDAAVADLHVWSIGPGIYSLIVSVVTSTPRPPEHYKRLLPARLNLVHRTVEVHHCEHAEEARSA